MSLYVLSCKLGLNQLYIYLSNIGLHIKISIQKQSLFLAGVDVEESYKK